jgi:hypothetical protein
MPQPPHVALQVFACQFDQMPPTGQQLVYGTKKIASTNELKCLFTQNFAGDIVVLKGSRAVIRSAWKENLFYAEKSLQVLDSYIICP